MGKVEWAAVGYFVLFALVLMREELSWLFTGMFLLAVAGVAGVFMFLITNE